MTQTAGQDKERDELVERRLQRRDRNTEEKRPGMLEIKSRVHQVKSCASFIFRGKEKADYLSLKMNEVENWPSHQDKDKMIISHRGNFKI